MNYRFFFNKTQFVPIGHERLPISGNAKLRRGYND